MRFRFASLSLLLVCPVALAAQSGVPRDPAAVAAVQASVAAMAVNIPPDSQATGTIQIVAGSENDSGTVEILTRGLDQTSEQIVAASNSRTVVYSQGLASETSDGTLKPLPMELAATSRCPDFPLPFLAATLNNPDEAFQFVGQETVEGRLANHVRFWDTFASRKGLEQLAGFTTTDAWIDAASRLPVRISYVRRNAGGSAPRILMDVYYSNYRSFGGVLYPLAIRKSLDGTPWETIAIQSVAFNVGLSDADFPVQ
jgi:hypothetical protein